jgi:hypothetical protein
VSTFSPLIQSNASRFSQCNRATERIKRDTNKKEEIKLSFLSYDMMLFLKDSSFYSIRNNPINAFSVCHKQIMNMLGKDIRQIISFI